MQALGLIETRGLLPAIECADVMLKTAQVELVERTFVGGGLVTIVVTGDVGAVKAAVEAAVTAVAKLGHLSLVSQHVIPRPHQEIETMVGARTNPFEEPPAQEPQPDKPSILPDADPSDVDESLANQDTATELTEPAKTSKESHKPAPVMLKQLRKEELDALVQEFGLEQSFEMLKSLAVVKLRNLAREYKELGIAGRAISKANKELLIQKLKVYYQRESEK